MHNTQRLVLITGVLLVAIAASVVAYNAGVSQGIAQSGTTTAAPPGAALHYHHDYHHRWHHPFGIVLFPLFFLGMWFLVSRSWWHRGWHGHACGCATERSEDDSHRR